MLRSLIVLAILSIPVGCRSQYGCNPLSNCGSRVPPPGTGSYGVPNTYYQNVPRTSTAPSTAPRTVNPSLSSWRNVEDGDDTTVVIAASLSANDTPVGTAVRGSVASSSTSRASTPKASSSQLRLNGMRVNEAKSAVSPASFDAPISEPASPTNQRVGDRSTDDAASSQPAINTLRNPSASLRTDAWQSRSAPATIRIANKG